MKYSFHCQWPSWAETSASSSSCNHENYDLASKKRDINFGKRYGWRHVWSGIVDLISSSNGMVLLNNLVSFLVASFYVNRVAPDLHKS